MSATNYITGEFLKGAHLPTAFNRTVVTLHDATAPELNGKGRDPRYVAELVHCMKGLVPMKKVFESGTGLQMKVWVFNNLLDHRTGHKLLRVNFRHVAELIVLLVVDINRYCRDTNQPAGRRDAMSMELTALFDGNMDLAKLGRILDFISVSAAARAHTLRQVHLVCCDYLAVHETTAKRRSMWLRGRDGIQPPPQIKVRWSVGFFE